MCISPSDSNTDGFWCKMTSSTHWTTHWTHSRLGSLPLCPGSPSISFPLSCIHKNPLSFRRWKGQKPPFKNTTGWVSEWVRGEQDWAPKVCVVYVCNCVWLCVIMLCLTSWGGRDVGKKRGNNWFWGEDWERTEHRVTKGVKEREKWTGKERERGGGMWSEAGGKDQWQKTVISIPEGRVIPSTQCSCPVSTSIKNPLQEVHCTEKTQCHTS